MSQGHRLGHVVLDVPSLDRSTAFYTEVMGLRQVGKLGSIIFFSFGGNHHDIALRKARAAGLHHLAFRIGDDPGVLRRFKAHLDSCGVRVLRARDHRVSKSLYFRDPAGMVIEVYVDAPAVAWRDDPSLVAYSQPLDLD